jgi:DHA3 family macrolide efflux protein-like MFS transporter
LASGGPVVSVVNDLRAGLKFVWGWPGMTLIILMVMLLNLLGTPALSLLPIMVSEHFGGGAVEFAWLESAWGVGMVLGGLTLGIWGGARRRMVTAMSALALQGVGLLVVGIAPATAFGLALGAILFTGLMNPVINGSVYATMQAVVPPQMQGRVFTLLRSGALGMTPLGLALAGPLADALSVQAWFLIAGVAACSMGLAAFFVPAIMCVEDRQLEPVVRH